MVDFYARGIQGYEQGRQRMVRNRLNELTNIAITSPPELQRGIAAEMARVDAATGQQFAEQARSRELERLRAQAAFMQSAAPEIQAKVYGAMRPGLQAMGIDAPEQYTPELAEPIRGAVFNLGASGVPAGLQEFNALTGMAGLSGDERAEAAKVRLGLRGRAPSAGFNWQKIQVGDQEIYVRNNPMTGETEYAQIGANGMPQPSAPQQIRVDLRGMQPESVAETRAIIEADIGRPISDAEWSQYTGQAQPQILGTNTVELAGRTTAAQEQAKADEARRTAREARAGALEGEREAQPLPADALKLVLDAEDKINGAANLQRRLSGWAEKIRTGRLQLSPTLNARWEAELLTNNASPQAIEYGNFKSDLESIRNDVLRLNAGVQTEGDATRAMNEILSNFGSGAYVMERMNTLAGANDRAVQFHRQQIDRINQNYNPNRTRGEDSPPYPGAKKAPDGKWYVEQNGQFFEVQ